jgi:hypothetical protein
MVVDDSDIFGTSVFPGETYPPLIIDADAELAGSIALQSFKPIARRNSNIRQSLALVEHAQLSERDILHIRRQLSAPHPRPDQLGFRVGKTSDHGKT